MSSQWIWIAVVAVGLIAALVYLAHRFYWAPPKERTYMTEGPDGYVGNLKGLGWRLNPLHFVVKGSSPAQRLQYLGVDPASNQRHMVSLLDDKTGALTLRPQTCAPQPFKAETGDPKRVLVVAKVMFSLDPKHMKYVYAIDNFWAVMEMRIQSAARAEFSKRTDEQLRDYFRQVQDAVLARLREDEAAGIAAEEAGRALGVKFLDFHYDYDPAANQGSGLFADTPLSPSAAPTDSSDQPAAPAGSILHQTVLSIDLDKLDRLMDMLKKKGDPNAIETAIKMMEMHTRQNTAGLLAGNVIVMTPQEIGLAGPAALFDALAKSKAKADGSLANSAGIPMDGR